MEVITGVLSDSEVVAASTVLARAFAQDPIITHYLSDPVRRSVAFPAFFEAVLVELLPSTQVFVGRSGTDVVGVAAWLPPDPVEPDAAVRDRAKRAERVVRTLFPASSGPLYEGFAALEQFHPETPHWYLAFVGIEPSLQGRGLGQDLLSPVLNVADETATPCYLETPFPATHLFYERLGFTRSTDRDTFAGAPTAVATFIRAPR